VGFPDPKRGEAVAAFVELREGRSLTEEELMKRLNGCLAPFKVPRKVVFVEALPRNPAGKILKEELKGRLETTARRRRPAETEV
jgi:fatty-acyl-CoA synthase